MSSELTRVTLNLLPRAAAALAKLTEFYGYNNTDTINRQLQLGAIIVEHLEAGEKLCFVAPDGAIREVIPV